PNLEQLGNKKSSTSRIQEEFTFTITLTGASNNPISGTFSAKQIEDGVINSDVSSVEFKNGTLEYKLKDKWTLVIEGLPDDAKYTVEENSYTSDGYRTTVAIGAAAAAESSKAEGTIDPDSSSIVSFVNTKNTYGDLTISKTVEGNANEEKSFTFVVELDDTTISGDYDATRVDSVTGTTSEKVTFTAGKSGKITLKDGQSLTILKLPNGVGYTVTETDYSADGYSTTVKVDGVSSASTSTGYVATGTITGTESGGTATPSEVSYTNTKDVGNLEITKTLAGNDISSDEVKDQEFTFTITLTNDTANNNTYTAVKTKADNTVDTGVTEVMFTNGVAEVKLKGGESILIKGILVGVRYQVTETGVSGYVEASTGSSGIISTDANSDIATVTAAFTNTRNTYGNLTVTKKVNGNGGDTNAEFRFVVKLSEALTGNYGDMEFIDGEATFYLKHGQSRTAEDLPNGISYTVTEVKEDGTTTYASEGYVTTSAVSGGTTDTSSANYDSDAEDGEGKIYANCELTETFTNTREIGTLTISKKLAGNDPSTSDAFSFTIALSKAGSAVSGTYTASGAYDNVTFDTNGEVTITLKGNEYVTIEGLPAGARWKVTEDETAASDLGYELEGIVTSGQKVEATANSFAYATGTIDTDEASTAEFTNEKNTYGDLTIRKTVEGNATDAKEENGVAKVFAFTITLDNSAMKNGTTFESSYKGMLYTSAADQTGTEVTVLFDQTTGVESTMTVGTETRTIALSDGQSLTVKDLPTGVRYTVTEADYMGDGYVTTYSGTTGRIYEDCSRTASFTNAKNVGDLKISKTLAGNATDSNKEFEFTVTLINLSGDAVSDTYDAVFYDGTAEQDAVVTFTNGTLSKVTIGTTEMDTLKLTDGQWILIRELPDGATFTVSETNYRQEGYYPSPTRIQEGKIHTAMESATAFTNTKNTYGDLTITKTVEGADADTTKAFQFTITLDDSAMLNSTTFEESYTAVLYDSTDSTSTTVTVIFDSTTGTATTMTVNGVTKDITLSHGQSLTIQNLPNGVRYTVTEADYSKVGYTVTSTGTTGTIAGVDTTSATGSETATAAFVNTYATSGDITLTAAKTLTGRTLTANQFTFTITEVNADGTAKANGFTGSAANNAAGAVTFPTIRYTRSGTYYYQIAEVNDGQSGYTYDGSVYTVTVTATDDGEGSLTAEVTGVSKDGSAIANGTAADVVFANTYAATGSLVLKAAKSMKRTDSTLGTFEFELTDVTGGTGTVLQTVTNDTTGAIAFAALEYTLDDAGKTYLYTVSEKTQTGTGYLFDGTIYTVTVNVTDNGNGTLAIAATVKSGTGAQTAYTDTAMTFVNDVTSVKVRKVDVTTSEELPGATIRVVDENGTVIDEWVSTTEDHEVTGLVPGKTYTLIETVAPTGYDITANTTFVLNTDGSIDTSKTTTTIKDGVLLVEDSMTVSTTATISVTKNLTYQNEAIDAVDQTFYVGLYIDAACTNLYASKAITFKNASSATVTFDGLQIGRTYYIAECDSTGKALASGVGTLADGTIFAADFGNGATTATTTVADGSQTTVTFANEFYTMPNGFYKEGTLTITKKLLDPNGDAQNSSEVFYAGIFADSSYTTLAANVSENIVKLDLAGNSSVSAEVGVSIETGETVTLYVTEVDADGNPVADAADFAYEVSVDTTKVTLDETTTTAAVTITNQEIEEVEEESEYEEETETETEIAAVQTGDETPLAEYLILLVLALAIILMAVVYRRRERKTRE
ncbi:MAG: DUF5979 domain-containing protein, partial [Lachnospiraceae bacterium]|nr:DUF5979 domain-containing protein [Lachnospiraceae bacterium]